MEVQPVVLEESTEVVVFEEQVELHVLVVPLLPLVEVCFLFEPLLLQFPLLAREQTEFCVS